MIVLEIAVIALLILLNGFLAMAELAVVSARRSRLQALAERGDPRAHHALDLADRPGRFLSTIQIGITLCGVLAGTFSGATIAERFADHLRDLGLSVALSDTLAFAVVVMGVTYLSLIVGELVPKQIALRNAERIALIVARPMTALSRATAPLGYVLDNSSRLVLHALGERGEREARVTEEEIKALIAEAETAGVVEPAERTMISSVLRLGDQPVRALMTPRVEVDWIDLDADEASIREVVVGTRHSRLVVGHGTIDEPVGIVQVKDMLDAVLQGAPLNLRTLLRQAPAIPDRFDVLEAIDLLKRSDPHIALVVDEHGTFEGIVTTTDILSAIAGAFRQAGEAPTAAVRRSDGSWLLDGAMPVGEMASLLGVELPAARDYHTLAGFMLDRLKHLPTAGEVTSALGWRFEVVDMDGRRIDKVLAAREAAPENSEESPDRRG